MTIAADVWTIRDDSYQSFGEAAEMMEANVERAPQTDPTLLYPFPPGFLWGTGTAAYQNEGNNFNTDWYLFERGLLEKKGRDRPIKDRSTAGRAVDFYHRYRSDFDEARKMGTNALRLSVEWARVEPYPGVFDDRELAHYASMVQDLRARGIMPLVTLHHFTNPAWVSQRGGWENPAITDYYDRYVEKVVSKLQREVDLWITFNEPMIMAAAGYVSGDFAPGRKHDVKAALAVAANELKAHARAYHIIHRLAGDRAMVGVANHMVYFAPLNTEGLLEQFDLMLVGVSERLINRTFPDAMTTGHIRMDAFLHKVEEFVPDLQGTMDFMGVNYYQRCLVTVLNPLAPNGTFTRPGTLRNDLGWEVVPEGMYRTLMAAAEYQKPIIITESGMADRTRQQVPGYIVTHLQQVHRAMQAGADVRGYIHWALTDNFEWHNGYLAKFGLLAIDPGDLELKREWTPGAYIYRDIALQNGISAELARRYGVVESRS